MDRRTWFAATLAVAVCPSRNEVVAVLKPTQIINLGKGGRMVSAKNDELARFVRRMICEHRNVLVRQ